MVYEQRGMADSIIMILLCIQSFELTIWIIIVVTNTRSKQRTFPFDTFVLHCLLTVNKLWDNLFCESA